MKGAYYNENDQRMADVLEELIRQGHIAPGVVDRRSILDVRVDDLRGFAQHHFFAGIGVWSHALRRAEWTDDQPVWTGSCPCQPFSLAGKGGGFDDPRHLWPHWVRLLAEYRPDQCFGEQVASAIEWLALVRTDLESLGYAFGAPDLAAAGFSGAHIRQRFFWVADADDAEWWADHAPRHIGDWAPTGRLQGPGDAQGRGDASWVGLSHSDVASALSGDHGEVFGLPAGEWPDIGAALPGAGDDVGLADAGNVQSWGGVQGPGEGDSTGVGAACERPSGLRAPSGLGHHQGLEIGPWEADGRGAIRFQGATAGPSSPLFGCDWLLCHDAKIRPVEPGTFPLAHEAPARVGRLHGYGNAIDAEALTQFISAFIEAKWGVF